jgi:hypothetical protein
MTGTKDDQFSVYILCKKKPHFNPEIGRKNKENLKLKMDRKNS